MDNMKLAFCMLKDAGLPQTRPKPEGMYGELFQLVTLHQLSKCSLRAGAERPEEHPEGPVFHVWEVQVSFPTATGSPEAICRHLRCVKHTYLSCRDHTSRYAIFYFSSFVSPSSS